MKLDEKHRENNQIGLFLRFESVFPEQNCMGNSMATSVWHRFRRFKVKNTKNVKNHQNRGIRKRAPDQKMRNFTANPIFTSVWSRFGRFRVNLLGLCIRVFDKEKFILFYFIIYYCSILCRTAILLKRSPQSLGGYGGVCIP